VLRGGFHFFFPFQYRIHSQPLVTIPQGQIGYCRATARRWAPRKRWPAMPPPPISSMCARSCQWRAKGPQRTILREGTYAINTAQFVIITRDRIHGLMLNANDGALFDQMQTLIAGAAASRRW
jgi:D-serine deaminase-like pyridoxal phosphate-dependent protein